MIDIVLKKNFNCTIQELKLELVVIQKAWIQ